MNDPQAEAKAATNLAEPALTWADPQAMSVDPRVLDAHGGFAWWYIDTIDNNGNGAVVIWSFGLPFLPGYLSSARRGEGQPARSRPSLNVALYRAGKRAFYLLQEYDPANVESDGHGGFRFAETVIRRKSDGLVVLDFDCALPGSQDRLQGQLKVSGPPARLADGLEVAPEPIHRWTPVLGPCRAEGQLRVGGETFTLDAPAYHDRNEGTHRLDDLGIDYWAWGRLVHPHRTAIWYLCFGAQEQVRAWAVELLEDGTVHLINDLVPELSSPKRGAFGLTVWQKVRLRDQSGKDWLLAETKDRVDDGPFYARTLAEVEAGSDRGLGLGEWIVPDRIDLARHRTLVSMAVHRPSGPNSFWLPLFSGSKAGRWGRLMNPLRGNKP